MKITEAMYLAHKIIDSFRIELITYQMNRRMQNSYELTPEEREEIQNIMRNIEDNYRTITKGMQEEYKVVIKTLERHSRKSGVKEILEELYEVQNELEKELES